MSNKNNNGHSIRSIHLIWILDCSSMMLKNNKIYHLNQSMKKSIENMKEIAHKNPEERIFVHAAKFSTGASWHIQQEPLDELEWKDLSAGGNGDVGEAFSILTKKLTSMNENTTDSTMVFFLISGSKSTENFKNKLEELKNQNLWQKSIRFAVAIGKESDTKLLNSFIDNPQYKIVDINIRNINFLEESIRRISAEGLELAIFTSKPVKSIEYIDKNKSQKIKNDDNSNSLQLRPEVDEKETISVIPINWKLIGKSIRGAQHKRSNTPKQDEISQIPSDNCMPPISLSMADGHGSEAHFRSHIGAKLAVEATEKAWDSLISNIGKIKNISKVKHWAESSIPKIIYKDWISAVADHLYSQPFSKEELATLELKRSKKDKQEVILNPLRAYGTTILSVLVTDLFIIYLQLGDGDIVTISESQKIMQPIPENEQLVCNEVTSLCLSKAWENFSIIFQDIDDSPPALIMISTDGLSDSFPSDKNNFLNLSQQFLESIRTSGPDKVSDGLEEWLEEASYEGSGDDISLGFIYRLNENKNPELKWKKTSTIEKNERAS